MLIFLLLCLVLSACILFVISSSFLGFLRTRVPFVPTGTRDVRYLVRQLPILPSDVVYDLGSGDGSMLFAVERISGAKGVGYELTDWIYLLSKIKRFFLKSRNVFYKTDFFESDLSEASIVYAYLYPPLMARVEQKFLTNCKPGTRAVVRDFAFPNLDPVEVIRTGKKSGNVFIDTKWNRFKILLKSLLPFRSNMSHEFFVYIR